MGFSVNRAAELIDSRRFSAALLSMLVAVLLSVQSADLNHTHEGELHTQYDCEICLKFGSEEDLLLSSETSYQFSKFQYSPAESGITLESSEVLSANPRAPPHA